MSEDVMPTEIVDEEEVKKVPDPSWCTLCDPHSWLSTARGDESVNPTLLMRMKAVPTLNPKCWDELFKATRPEKYYWCETSQEEP